MDDNILSRISTWELKIKINPILTINGEIFNISESSNFPGLDDIKNMSVSIHYDLIELYSSSITVNPTTFCANLPDDKKNINHRLNITLQNKVNGHTVYLNNKHITLAIDVTVFVENMCINLIIYKLGIFKEQSGGVTLIGENGTLSIDIKTPIYKWLLDHKKLLL